MRPPVSWQRARVTLGIAGLTALAWLVAFGTGHGDIAAVWGGFIPARVGGLPGDDLLAPLFLTPLTATLAHGGFAHLASNLVILLFCGRSVENIVGPKQMLVLYVLGAYAAAAVHYLVDPSSTAPMVGASGAVSAVIGVFALLFGRNKVKVANPTLALALHALWLLAAWVVLQILVGFTFQTAGVRIAVGAHVGGFLAGMLLMKPLLLWRWRGA